MLKSWNEMTADEKANKLSDDLDSLITFVNRVSLRVGELAKRVDALEAVAQTVPPNSDPAKPREPAH
jgi:hypothetical protein